LAKSFMDRSKIALDIAKWIRATEPVVQSSSVVQKDSFYDGVRYMLALKLEVTRPWLNIMYDSMFHNQEVWMTEWREDVDEEPQKFLKAIDGFIVREDGRKTDKLISCLTKQEVEGL